MKLNFKIHNHIKYIYLTAALIAVFWFISVYGLYSSQQKGVVFDGYIKTYFLTFINDFWTGSIIGILFFPIYLLLKKYFNKISFRSVFGFFILIILLQLALVKYHNNTLLNLGVDVFGYSFSEILTTSSSTNEISFLLVFPIVIFTGMLFIFYNYFRKLYNPYFPIIFLFSFIILGSLKFSLVDGSKDNYQNKIQFLINDIIRFNSQTGGELTSEMLARNDYPLLQNTENVKDVLKSYLNVKEEKPNIIFIVVEGLGSDFVGEKAQYKGFTPFLDSLTQKSLFWNNFVATSGRTYGVLPSLFGSLPYGNNGFLEIKDAPSHLSLISLLNYNDYETSFYTGYKSSFDRKINLLEYAGINNIIEDEKFGSDYRKADKDTKGFTWGYPDKEIYKKVLASIEPIKKPRLDIIFTITNHEPFIFPEQSSYLQKVDKLLETSKLPDNEKEVISVNKEVFASLLYTDNSLKGFIKEYQKRDDYENTIFIITGDHRLIPIPQKDKLCRFHVPFYIFSPLVKEPKQFNSVSSHLDVAPSLFSFLYNNHKFKSIDKVAWIGNGLDTVQKFRNIHKIPLMRNKGTINDFIFKDYFYSNNELFKIKPDLSTYKVKEDEILKELKDSLNAFKNLNTYITKRNKIFPDSINYYSNPLKKFTKSQLQDIEELTEGLTFDEIFNKAKDLAIDNDRVKARLLCDYILNEFPNQLDARTLKGRTLAWDKKYDDSEIELLNVINRGPFYEDGYLALLDLYWWSNQDNKSINIEKSAKNNKLQSSELSFKLAKAHHRLGSHQKAKFIIDSIIRKNPSNNEFKKYRQTLN